MVSALMIPMLAGIWWKRATNRGAALSLICGGVAYAVLYFGFSLPTFSQIFISVPISLVAMIIGSLTDKENDEETIALVADWHAED